MKCTRCYNNQTLGNSRICPSCLTNWTKMRTAVFEALENKYGKLNSDNHQTFIKETKRLERIWRIDKEKFKTELELIK